MHTQPTDGTEHLADGIVLLAKKPGPTSFSSLNSIKKALNTKKVGHTGTLDSFAQGLLVVCTGRLTKIAGNITEFDKEYEAVIKFGEETDTLENTGIVIRTAPLPNKETLENAIKNFTGLIQQKPPAFSAIHVDGKRASDLARNGKEVELPARPVTVYSAEILETKSSSTGLIEYCMINFSVSKGTYIRSLARDIAKECGSAAHLIGLYRKNVGNFYIEDAAGFLELEEFNIENCIRQVENGAKAGTETRTGTETRAGIETSTGTPAENKNITSLALHEEIIKKKMDFLPQTAELCGFDVIKLVSKDAENAFKNGKPLKNSFFDKNLQELLNKKSAAVFTQDGHFCGLINKNENGKVSYSFVLN